MRYVVTDAAGNIIRQGGSIAPPLQIDGGDRVYVLASYTGGYLPEGGVRVSAEGVLELVDGYEGELPDAHLTLVAPE